jgi:hypothetical protein
MKETLDEHRKKKQNDGDTADDSFPTEDEFAEALRKVRRLQTFLMLPKVNIRKPKAPGDTEEDSSDDSSDDDDAETLAAKEKKAKRDAAEKERSLPPLTAADLPPDDPEETTSTEELERYRLFASRCLADEVI